MVWGRMLVSDWAPIQEEADPKQFSARVRRMANTRAEERINGMNCEFTSLGRAYGMG